MNYYDYMNYARSFGYSVRFTEIGMGYVVFGELKLTKTMDKEDAERELALIGMSIMQDTLRKV